MKEPLTRVPLIPAVLWFSLFFANPSAATAEERLLLSGKRQNIWDLYWAAETSGTIRLEPITRTPEPEGNPAYWARHDLILATVQRASGVFGLTAFTPTGEERWRWDSPSAGASVGWAQPSPWDDRILAVLELPDGSTEVGMIDLAEHPGRESAWQTISGDGRPGGQPAWYAPNVILLSRVNPDGSFDLCEHDLADGSERTIVHGGRNWQVATGPNGGDPVLFTRRVGQTSAIFRLRRRPDGTWDEEQVSQARPYDWQPSVSPDGRETLFLSLRQGNFRLVRRSLETGCEREIELPGLESAYHPTLVIAPAQTAGIPGPGQASSLTSKAPD
ncbi:MAG TPA: hypothetical protein PLU72_07435 [Candidatus Ozemobacteraceae bacterium]|nr:hypothetical protein [Candidatus Ozemobacteraceae bacterium]